MARLTITDHRGALERGEEPSTRTVEVAGRAQGVAGELAAVVLCLPPEWPTPGTGTHWCLKAGGFATVTITDD